MKKKYTFSYYGWIPGYDDFDVGDISVIDETEEGARAQLEDKVKRKQLFPKYGFGLESIEEVKDVTV